MSSKNVTLFLGVALGLLGFYCTMYFIPSSLLLLMSSILSFETTIKKRKEIETFLSKKLEDYEEKNEKLKNDLEKLKIDLESIKTRVNIGQMYQRNS